MTVRAVFVPIPRRAAAFMRNGKGPLSPRPDTGGMMADALARFG